MIFDAHCHCPKDIKDLELLTLGSDFCMAMCSASTKDFNFFEQISLKNKTSIIPGFGIHPWFADEWNEDVFALLKEKIQKYSFAYIGEIGLDKVHFKNFEKQIHCFESQYFFALENRLPIVIHCVRAQQELVAIFKKGIEYKKKLPVSFLLHGFMGDKQSFLYWAKKGAYFSVNERNIKREWIKEIPEDKLLIESDSDSIEKSQLICESILEKLVECRNQSLASLKKNINENAWRFFCL